MRGTILLPSLLALLLCGCQRQVSQPAPASAPVAVVKAKKKARVWTPQTSLLASDSFSVSDDGKVGPLLRAISLSLEYLRRSKKKTFVYGARTATRQELIDTLLDLKAKLGVWGLGARLYRYIAKTYLFFESASKKDVFFTGYYEASLRGSRVNTEQYRYPLYRKPPDLVRIALREYPLFSRFPRLPKLMRGRLVGRRVVPYYTRAEIEGGGKLKGKGLELVWIDNPIDVAFLQIQGSGIVTLPDGKTMRVNYADKNGHSYRPIGRLLLQEGHISRKQMSMQSIRAYLEKHPKDRERVLDYNPSYVFFREVKRGPLGSLGVPVTAFRSIATDRFLFPKGALCLIQVSLPTFDASGKQIGSRKSMRFVLNQDTGGAIRTPRRVDLFTGYGKQSELVAGHLKSKGRLFFLLKKR